MDGQTQTQLQQPVAWRHCADPDPQRGSPDIALTVVAPAKCDNAGSAGAGRVELRVAPGSRRPVLGGSAQENPGFSGFSPFDLRQANASLTEPS